MLKRICLLVVVFMLLAVAIGDAAFIAGRLSSTTTAAALYTAPRTGAMVLFCNRDATVPVFIGGSNVTTANGFEISAGACTSQRPYPRDSVWFVSASTVRVDYAEGSYRE